MTAASSLPPSRREPLPPGFHVETAWSPTLEEAHREARVKRGGKRKAGQAIPLVDPVMADRGAGTAPGRVIE